MVLGLITPDKIQKKKKRRPEEQMCSTGDPNLDTSDLTKLHYRSYQSSGLMHRMQKS